MLYQTELLKLVVPITLQVHKNASLTLFLYIHQHCYNVYPVLPCKKNLNPQNHSLELGHCNKEWYLK